jgi:hypothetical protein
MRGPKKLLALIGTLVLVGAMLMPVAVFGDTTDTATGTFSNNNVPSIDYVQLWNTSGPAEVTAMTPQVEYDARVKVTDADLKTDLTTIVVKVWYDADGGTPTSGEFDAISAGDAQTAIIITWTEGATFVLTEETGSSWVLGTCVAPEDLTGYFQFKFTVGKVATEAATANGWQIAARVTDDSAQTAWNYDAQGSTMAWYGEISGVSGTVDWGTVNPGMDFAEGGSSEEALGVTINYISNGAFDEKVKSDASWTGGSGATLDADGSCTNANEFALKADDSGTLASAVLVDATGVAIDDTGALTEEVGHDAAANALWLKLASTFSKATYSGTITYIIADGS